MDMEMKLELKLELELGMKELGHVFSRETSILELDMLIDEFRGIRI